MQNMKKSVLRGTTVKLLFIVFCCWSVLIHSNENNNESRFQVEDSLEIDSLKIVEFETDSLFYSADSVFYFSLEDKIKLTGNAAIKYENSNIKADTISIDLKKEQAFSKGQSFLQDGTQILLGREIYYDFNQKVGLIKHGASKFDKGFYYGDEIRKVGKKTYDVDNGKFTTCSSLNPHFYIHAYKFRLYRNDKIVAKPIIFSVNHFPVFILPCGTFTVKRGRERGILVPSPGYNSVDGKFIENIAFYYPYKNYADIILAFNYYEKTGWEVDFNGIYKKRYSYYGNFDTRFQKKIQGPDVSRQEWYIKTKHHSDLSNRKTFDVNLEFLSSTRVFEGSTDIDERLIEKITSSLAYKKPFLNSILNLSAKYVDNLEEEKKDITLPSISYSLPSKPVYELFISDDDKIQEDSWFKGFSFSYSFLATHIGDINDPDANFEDVIYKTKTDSLGNHITQHNAGVKHYGRLSYTYKYKGWLNLSQSISGNEAWFDRDTSGTRFVRGSDYKTSTNLSFSLYGAKEIPRFYIKAVRHIITPSLSFSYRPDFTENSKYYSFGGISLNRGSKQRSISISLTNKWQLKLAETETKKERKLNDFFKISSKLSYNFEAEGKGFSNVSHTINLNPKSISFDFFNLSIRPWGTLTQDPYELKFNDWDRSKWDLGISNWTFNLNTKLTLSGDANYIDYFPEPENEFVTGRFFQDDTLTVEEERIITTLKELEELSRDKKNWSISFSHTYKTNKTNFENKNYTSDLRMSLSAKISKNWSVSYNNYINLKDNELVSHNFTITRDLHCWKIVFKYTKQGDYWNYQFKLFNIKLPDALQFRTSDHKS